ncbi:GspE/PulE family protein [methane-oxidizing endosymbiont of Gigantopelta aegis]|uniref:GspE/PulE family protein n=1 Tax=methane-oxidizing endosymbiont of Gigantopelta aegis TaxID=2794938 RepID=UPI0018DB1EA2|nr:GspE/PulE family protein [methane-oxidizing endosymbiont of Gigantopelta aegis]
MAIAVDKLLEAGVQCGLIDNRQLKELRLLARKTQQPLLLLVQAHYRFPLSVLYHAVAEQAGLLFVDLSVCQVNEASLKKIPPSLVRRKQVLPVVFENSDYLAVADPFDRVAIDSVMRLTGGSVPLVLVDPVALNLKIRQLQSDPVGDDAANVDAEQPDLIAILDAILREAYFSRASDIHLITEKNGIRVRFRVDGRLRDHPVEADGETAAALISRIKVLSELDISEQRMPQDGGFSYHLAPPVDKTFNIRVATAPIRLGERVTLRLLGQEISRLSLKDLGMLADDLEHFKQAIEKPYGLILLTGPTGSGKSTTLSAALEEINHPDINIMTVENPIEYVIPGASQVQTGPKVTFASALRSFLRHDPDVLMVGEIRDFETADVAVKAAMTGHMVFSTLHTNNAVSAITRLIDIGCESFLIGSTITAVIAQRLVRRLCSHCRQPYQASETEAVMLGQQEQRPEIYQASGCARCQGSGFSGRLGLFETLWFDDTLARAVMRGADEEALEKQAGSRLRFMWEDGARKVLQGLTTLDELNNVAVFKTRDMLEDTP